MTPVATAYPPPLSAPPTVDALRDLLDGLQDPTGTTGALPPPPPGTLTTTLGTTELQALLVGLRRSVTGGFDSATVWRWRVEHARTGVPVWLGVGDRLSVRQLTRLRNELLPPPVVAVRPTAPVGRQRDPGQAARPPVVWRQPVPDRSRFATGWGAGAVAVAVIVTLAVAALIMLGVSLTS